MLDISVNNRAFLAYLLSRIARYNEGTPKNRIIETKFPTLSKKETNVAIIGHNKAINKSKFFLIMFKFFL